MKDPRAYRRNDHCADDRGHDHKGCATEEAHQREFAAHADVYGPQELTG